MSLIENLPIRPSDVPFETSLRDEVSGSYRKQSVTGFVCLISTTLDGLSLCKKLGISYISYLSSQTEKNLFLMVVPFHNRERTDPLTNYGQCFSFIQEQLSFEDLGKLLPPWDVIRIKQFVYATTVGTQPEPALFSQGE